MLYFLPGLGAGPQMYVPPWPELRDARYLSWPACHRERSLTDIARRIIDEHDLTSEDLPCGVSLGGIVALEIAALLDSPRALLISSALQREEINRLLLPFTWLAYPGLIHISQALAACIPGRLPKLFRQADPRFVAVAAHALRRWEPPSWRGSVWRVHGDRDHVIHCPPDAEIIPGAGHLAAITHPRECVAAVQRLLETQPSVSD